MTAIDRVKEALCLRNIRTLLGAVLGITLIISIFEFTPDLRKWLVEIAGNFILAISIAFPGMILGSMFDTERIRNSLLRLAALMLLYTVSGIIGGLIGWGINSVLFPFHISHPFYFLFVVAVLSNVFGISLFTYYSVRERLEETARKLAEKEINEQKLVQLKMRAELEALRAKTNPHFLFNTLNSIASLIPDDPKRAEEMVQKLSNIFQYTLKAASEEFVTLGDELRFIESYLEIEKVRLGERLEYSIRADDASAPCRFPGMLLQPLVENSIKYGVAPEKDGGSITIECRQSEGRCRVGIVDTGPGFDAFTVPEGFGISSVRERLELLYGDRHTFDLSTEGGVSIVIEIPSTL
ncbi:MAG: histidine kinase [Bacteroidales bacterium]|nr:histidine kinase [Candidatus Latescibacterota bacterium]